MKPRIAGKKKGLHLIITLIVMLVGSVVCNASPITYNVARTIGVGSVTGFIETDGSLGVLSAADFVDWSLLLNRRDFHLYDHWPLEWKQLSRSCTGRRHHCFSDSASI